jgi:medium-chain acyl-[acyl-carrier-protein] hydrolase
VSSWILSHPAPPAPRVRLVCLPYSGGGASMYRSWCEELAPDIEVVPIQPPGRENRFREPALTSMDAILSHLLPVVSALRDRPLALFGHSVGARIAYELVLRMRATGMTLPVHLFVSACRAAHLNARHPLMGGMDDEELLHSIVARYGADAQVKDEELYRLMLPTIRSDIVALETCPFTGTDPLDLPMTGLGGTADLYVTQDEIEAWRDRTTAPFDFRMFEGAHFYLNGARQDLLSLLRQKLLA